MSTAVIYYTDGRLGRDMEWYCWDRLFDSACLLDIIRIYQHPKAERSLIQLFINVLCGIGQTDAEYIYLAEHDVLYPEGYFAEITEPIEMRFNQGGYFLDSRGYYKREHNPLSSLCGHRDAMRSFMLDKLKALMTDGRLKQVEPERDKYEISYRQNELPYVDIRHGGNVTGDRAGKEYFESIPYWDDASVVWEAIGGGE